MIIAITGPDGFIGSQLIKKLNTSKKDNICHFDRKVFSLFSISSLKNFVKNKDVIIHLAGINLSQDPNEYYLVNTLGTLNLLEAIRLFGKKNCHFILSSSFAIYQINENNTKLKEDSSPLKPRNHYGMSKLLAETIASQYKDTIGKITILRIANAYGKNDKLISSLINNLIKGNKFKLDYHPKQIRDYIYIDDIVRAIINTIRYQKKKFSILNVCSGKKTTVSDFFNEVEMKLNKKGLIKYNNKRKENGYWVGNNKKALKEIKFTYITDYKTGIAKTLK